MDASAVAEYLKQHPEFFENYADAVAEIFVPHPHGGHAIPIAERQILALRERTRELERRLGEMIRHGSDNDAISEKLHRSTLALFAARDIETTLAVLAHSLREDFSVPQVALRLWAELPDKASLTEFGEVSRGLRDYADRLREPYCGPEALPEARGWFETSPVPASFAFLPLRTEATFGVLALASSESQRFHPAMGTVYLLRLAELASVAIARFLPLA